MSHHVEVFEQALALGRNNPENTALLIYINAYPVGRTLAQMTLGDFAAYMALFPGPYVGKP